MAENKGLLEEKLTESCADPTPATSPSERPQSSGSEITFKELPVIKQDIMGSSIQPSRAASSINISGDEAQEEPSTKLDDSHPSSLHSTSTCTTYSLEISSNKESRPLPLQSPSENKDLLSTNPDRNPATLMSLHSKREMPDPAVTNSQRPVTRRRSRSLERSDDFKLNLCTEKLENAQIEPKMSPGSELKQTISSSPINDEKLGAQPFSAGIAWKVAPPRDVSEAGIHEGDWRAGQEKEPEFYAFVILHDQADSDEAVRLKIRMESISSTTGATFAEDFAEPGRSTFSSVEDAIENSAYVMLLLTPNFNTHLNETNTDSALLNSIDKPHKYNTVIPLIPADSSVKLPLVLKTKNPLRETNRGDIFEKLVRKVLNPRNITRQKTMWSQEQHLKSQQEKANRLREENRLKKKTNEQDAKVRELQEERMRLNMPQQWHPPPFVCQPSPYQAFYRPDQSYGPGPSHCPGQMPPYRSGSMIQQPPSSIYIQNAKYIMVGDNSTMTVEGAVGSEDEDSP